MHGTFARPLMLVLCLGALSCSGGGGETETTSTSETGETGETSETGETGPGDQTLRDHLWSTWGIRLHDFDVDVFDVDSDGTQQLIDDGTIEVEGLGMWEISTMTIIDPAAMGGQTSVFISNTDLTEERYFLYDPVENYITIGDLTKGVSVSKNPDNTYDVWAFDGDAQDEHMTVNDGFAALQLVEQYNEFKVISPYILLSAFALAHTSTPEARMAAAVGRSNVASDMPVCDIFKEFCDCAACLVLDREGACEPCPQL
ncbi:MAG: hypothetical protein ACPG4T_19385 [Nannocystaceae bacterium]